MSGHRVLAVIAVLPAAVSGGCILRASVTQDSASVVQRVEYKIVDVARTLEPTRVHRASPIKQLQYALSMQAAQARADEKAAGSFAFVYFT